MQLAPVVVSTGSLHMTGESGGTWATAGIKVLDPYNSNSGSTEGRRVTILEAMQTSHVTLGVDRIRIPN